MFIFFFMSGTETEPIECDTLWNIWKRRLHTASNSFINTLSCAMLISVVLVATYFTNFMISFSSSNIWKNSMNAFFWHQLLIEHQYSMNDILNILMNILSNHFNDFLSLSLCFSSTFIFIFPHLLQMELYFIRDKSVEVESSFSYSITTNCVVRRKFHTLNIFSTHFCYSS